MPHSMAVRGVVSTPKCNVRSVRIARPKGARQSIETVSHEATIRCKNTNDGRTPLHPAHYQNLHARFGVSAFVVEKAESPTRSLGDKRHRTTQRALISARVAMQIHSARIAAITYLRLLASLGAMFADLG